MSTEPRTITLVTEDHGPVALPEPGWCRGHADHQPGTYRVDLTHYGTETVLRFEGAEVFRLLLAESPYATRPVHQGVCGYVETCGYTASLSPAGLYGLAAALDAHADRLREFADQLTLLRGEQR